jgi:hypothetical protein
MEFVIVLLILTIVVIVVTAPLRRSGPVAAPSNGAHPSPELDGALRTELASLEAARDAKYREIRDAELDHRTGKLSDADFEELDRGLRAEAVEILHALDRARAASSGP